MNAALWLLLLARGTYRAPPVSDPIDWIGFTATGSVSIASASGEATRLDAASAMSYATTAGSESTLAATGAQSVATITGRPYE